MVLRRLLLLGALGALCAAGPALASATSSDAPSPSCLPRTLDPSGELAGTPILVSPLPGSADATPSNQISFLGAPAATLSAVTVTGSLSGPHAGTLEPYSQGDGASFVPELPFTPGETVTVAGTYTGAGAAVPFSFSFTVATIDPIAELPESGVTSGPRGTILHFHSAPTLTPPEIMVFDDQRAARAGGDIFTSVYPGPGQTGPEIMAPDGQPVWFLPLPTGTFATNLLVQQYEGEPVLSWWQGVISQHGFGLGEDEIYNDQYQPVATVAAGNGLKADLHEFQITAQGTALITAWKPIYCDLAPAGGAAHDAIYDPVMQEIDIKTGLVMYEWDSLDHVAVRDSYAPAKAATTSWPWDWFHMNSLQVERDGSWLIDSRATWAMFDVNSSTGQIIWRLGGRQSSFKLEPGAAFSWQHDARQLSGNLISLFDNSGPPTRHPKSKGLVLRLNQQNHTASLVRAILPPSPLFAQTQGDVQLLPGGDWFVGFGDTGEISEVSASGRTIYVAHSPDDTEMYRAERFAWSGDPTTPPAIALEPSKAAGSLAVYASWNGATSVARWQLLSGASATALSPTGATVASKGFETKLSAPQTPPFVAVEALGASGTVLGTSAAVATSAVTATSR